MITTGIPPERVVVLTASVGAVWDVNVSADVTVGDVLIGKLVVSGVVPVAGGNNVMVWPRVVITVVSVTVGSVTDSVPLTTIVSPPTVTVSMSVIGGTTVIVRPRVVNTVVTVTVGRVTDSVALKTTVWPSTVTVLTMVLVSVIVV